MKNLIAFSLAEYGAMGCPNEVIFVFREDDALRFLYTSTGDDITAYVPWLSTLKCDLFGIVRGVGEGWEHVNLGMGNHLFLLNSAYDLLKERIDGKSPSQIYQTWRDDLCAVLEARTVSEEYSDYSCRNDELDRNPAW